MRIVRSDALDSSYKKDGLREDWDKPRNDAPPAKPEGKERLLSLDVFRGLTVVIMVRQDGPAHGCTIRTANAS